jgi:hypothetical protein
MAIRDQAARYALYNIPGGFWGSAHILGYETEYV